MIRRQNRMKTSPGADALELLRSQGRYGDTELAHVNPREKALLKALGGAGSRNPRTGLREFYEAGVDVGGGAQGPSAQGDLGLGSGPPSDFGGPVGGYLESASTPIDNTTTPQGSSLGLGDRVVEAANSLFGNLNTSVPISPASLAAYGVARGLGGLAESIGVGGPSRGTAAEFGGGMGEQRGGDNFAASMDVIPVSAPMPKYLRGGEMAPPQEISSFIGPGMSDIQQRALISTYGTQGVNSAFRTDPVRRYYANLLSRGLISDAGAPVQNPYVLPIEQQYASSVLGRPFANPADAAATYESIRGFL
jgi:hypothetical protein